LDKYNYHLNEYLENDVSAYLQSHYIDGEITPSQSTLTAPFATTLTQWMDIKGISAVECYRRANVSKQTWDNIVKDEAYQPTKTTVLAFAVASTTLKMLFSIAIKASNLVGVTTNCAIINTGCEQKQHTKCHC
jgi:hypothetical protein